MSSAFLFVAGICLIFAAVGAWSDGATALGWGLFFIGLGNMAFSRI